jgi:hypothetical protein
MLKNFSHVMWVRALPERRSDKTGGDLISFMIDLK